MNRKQWTVLGCSFFVLAVLLYAPSLGGPWQYDDYAQILDQKVLTARDFWHLIPSVFRFSAWPDGWTGTRDFVRATFWLNWKWWNLEPLGYRWVNLVIHIVNAFLVTVLVAELLGEGTRAKGQRIRDIRANLSSFGPWPLSFGLATLSGLLFLIHPIQSQGVAYVAQRFASMATMFYIGSVLAWVLALRTSQRQTTFPSLIAWYALALFSALLALNSKEIAMTLPGALVLVTMFLKKATSDKPSSRATQVFDSETQTRGAEGRLATSSTIYDPRSTIRGFLPFVLLLPFFLFSLKIPLQVWSSSTMGWKQSGELVITAITAIGLDQKNPPPTRVEYFLTELNVVRTYLRLLIVPLKQTLDYDYPITKGWDAKTVASGVLHLGLIGAGGWLMLGLKDEGQRLKEERQDKSSSLGPWPLALGLRLIGLGILWFYLTISVESSVIPIPDVIYEHRVYLPFVGVAITAVGIVLWIKEFLHRAGLWEWRKMLTALAITWVVFLCGATVRRAWVWGNEVRLWKDVYEKAPNKARANKNYGVVLAASGDYDPGIERLKRANELDPVNADYASNLGTAYLRAKKFKEAAAQFIRAYNLAVSESEQTHQVLPKEAAQYISDYGVTMVQMEQGEGAARAFGRALEINPDLYAAKIGLGAAKNLLGDLEGAAQAFRELTIDHPGQADAFGNLATILTKQGNYAEALTALMSAGRIQPNFPDLNSRIAALTKRITGSGK